MYLVRGYVVVCVIGWWLCCGICVFGYLGIWYLVGGYAVAYVYLGIWYLVGGWVGGWGRGAKWSFVATNQQDSLVMRAPLVLSRRSYH